jgi:predicted DNA-binding transcriptional regulator AlpA
MDQAVLTAERPTLKEVRTWPATVGIPPASAALGISRSHGYELAARDEFPARLIRAGGRVLVVTADLIKLLSAE